MNALERSSQALVDEPVARLSGLSAPDRELLVRAGRAALDPQRHGDLPHWAELLDAVPSDEPKHQRLDGAVVTIGAPPQPRGLRETLQGLIPWRKGPFEVRGVSIDAEWRSNLKWSRLEQAVDWNGRSVLDVGCGNGYYALRALGKGARSVLGIDPAVLACTQFAAVTRGCQLPAAVLPLRLEDLPGLAHRFDVVMSLGVLGHRRDPLEHLQQLRQRLAAGGFLVLETLVVDAPPDEDPTAGAPASATWSDGVFRPGGRYAAMRNVYHLPCVERLQDWLIRSGFTDVTLLDVGPTTVDEQRSTPWMPWQSLPDFLSPTDRSRTIEGHPAPRRAVVRAKLDV